jgi:hypothetical protein
MTRNEFRDALDALSLTQSAFARLVEHIGGERLPLRTVQRWALGEASVPPVVPALIALLLEEDAKQGRQSAEEWNAERAGA